MFVGQATVRMCREQGKGSRNGQVGCQRSSIRELDLQRSMVTQTNSGCSKFLSLPRYKKVMKCMQATLAGVIERGPRCIRVGIDVHSDQKKRDSLQGSGSLLVIQYTEYKPCFFFSSYCLQNASSVSSCQ